MKAAVIRAVDDRKVLVTEQVPDPLPAADEVLIRVTHAGICGSDLHGYLDAAGTSRRDGLIMGHEIAGTVVSAGSDVVDLEPGTTVTVDPQVVCGECSPCRNGWISICDHKMVTGSSLRGFSQGGMAELIAVRHSQVYPVPAGMPGDQAALIEPLSNAMHVVSRIRDVAGAFVVVLGAGPLGLCLIQALRNAGAATVVVSDLSDFRLGVAAELGAARTVNPLMESLDEVVSSLTEGAGADVVVESAGVDVTYQQAVRIVRKRGQVMFFGAVQDTVTLPLLTILHRELDLIGCTGANDETAAAIAAVADGSIDLRPMLTHTFPLEQADHAMQVLSDPGIDTIKVQVTP